MRVIGLVLLLVLAGFGIASSDTEDEDIQKAIPRDRKEQQQALQRYSSERNKVIGFMRHVISLEEKKRKETRDTSITDRERFALRVLSEYRASEAVTEILELVIF